MGETTGARREGEGVIITQREIYDEVRDVSSKLDLVLNEMPVLRQRVAEHDERLRNVETKVGALDPLPATVGGLATVVADLRDRVNRSDWLPRLAFSLIAAGLGALLVWIIIPN